MSRRASASCRWARSPRPSCWLAATPVSGHPLGNFSISHYAGIEIGADAVRIRYVVDMAEIPTFQEMQDAGLVAEPGHPSVAPWVARTVSALGRGLRLEVDGARLALTPGGSEIIFPPGAGGLPTLKLGAVYSAPLECRPHPRGHAALRRRELRGPGGLEGSDRDGGPWGHADRQHRAADRS